MRRCAPNPRRAAEIVTGQVDGRGSPSPGDARAKLTLTLKKTAALDADAERAFRKKLATPR